MLLQVSSDFQIPNRSAGRDVEMALRPNGLQAAEQMNLTSTAVFTLTAPLQVQADGRSFLSIIPRGERRKSDGTLVWREGPQQQTELTTISNVPRLPPVICTLTNAPSFSQTPSRSARRKAAKRQYARLAREAAAAGGGEAAAANWRAPRASAVSRTYDSG
jgi:hypothetical protein